MAGEQLQAVPIRLTSHQHSRLRHWCAQHNFTMATVIRGLVDQFLDSQTLNRPSPQADDPPEHS
ncbi:MAG: hypothetical protein JO100_06350 [Pseudonocardia sp.]|nr:hypothetical protein [Pseudonocardia sp.]